MKGQGAHANQEGRQLSERANQGAPMTEAKLTEEGRAQDER